MYNTELNYTRKIIWLRKSEVSVGGISVCNVTEKLEEYGIPCLPCSYTKDFKIFYHATDVTSK